ncbi:hypothetical protein F5Y14DRAFT_56101 [Nemania sp. NC0429]|nr:hypothetical protein F5Y14DRAFT_56101 [Nemania sp. NC0429]
MTSGDSLTAAQLRALLDILIHHETYAEVQSFQDAQAIETYGWPFVDRDEKGGPAKPHDLSSSPLLQLLLTRLLLGAPAARDLSTEFWPVKFKGIMRQLGDADLSDSYDKGTLGTRKRLATAASVIHEAVTRGLLSGVSCDGLPDLHFPYDEEKAEHLTKAWHDCVRHLVYGDLVDGVFDQLTRTEDLEAHSPALKAAVQYAELYIATFLHQTFILSAEGPYLLKLIENVHRLVPYTVIGQTLRLGNAASMINAMSRLFLSKLSVGAMTNWMGLTSNAANGMNLLQRIISLVLEWDAADFRKSTEKMKLDRNASSEQMSAIDRHLAADRNQHELARKKSILDKSSIIFAIFEIENPQLLESLTDRQHISCLEYYAAQLAIRDREHITDVLCNSSPDLTTAIVLEGLAALDPMIRVVHKNVDLRKHLGAMESFLGDFIKTAKPKAQDKSSKVDSPAVQDFVRLLQRNDHLLWSYLHDFCSGCPELRDTWREWMKGAIKVFRRKSESNLNNRTPPVNGEPPTDDAGDMRPILQDSFDKLTESQRGIVLERIDVHSEHLATLGKLSKAKMQKIIDELHGRSQAGTGDVSGPGIYASRWQALLDQTLVTPVTPKGPLRSGKDVKRLRAARKPGTQGDKQASDADAAPLEQDGSSGPAPPDVSAVVEMLGSQFKDAVARISRDGLQEGEP